MAPLTAVPLPAGRPPPSGATLMSHAAISAEVAGRPRLGPAFSPAGIPPAVAHPASRTAAAAAVRLGVDILHLAVGRHTPGLNRVVMEDGIGPVLSDQRVALGLDRSRFIAGAALEDSGPSAPDPRDPKARERTRQRGRRQRGVGPT